MEATATTVKDAEAMNESSSNAEEAEKIAASRAEEARLRVEEQKASVKDNLRARHAEKK